MRIPLAGCLLCLFVATVDAADGSHPRSLDPELQITLFAEHPTIVTPTGIDVDYKGRVFAIESNTHFPPKGYKGHKTDRLLVLEDTNGDGKADKTTL
ncbi:MAG: cytochrome C, partial [Planctomycetaceae bacterium]